mmetsp:Transcript_24482/g.36001  ORF Transcript_24482/g.36001 Transcript_24482/m.36001 type:complete len:403 (-) Transcript_24482:85-1293(-)
MWRGCATSFRHARQFCSAAAKATKKTSAMPYVTGVAVLGGIAIVAEDVVNTPDGMLSSMLGQKGVTHELYDSIFGGVLDSILLPSSDELLPDWPTAPCYAGLNIPPGTPAPPLLVVDLEKTLIASEHDPRYGWRHVKRPGVDKFIEQLSNYYEIVIFAENDIGMMEHVLMAIDKEGRTHKLGPAAGEARGDKILKRLDCMNRDIRRIILIDDSQEAAQLFPRNTIFVKPFDDVRSKGDTTLTDLIPVLQAIVHDENVRDFRTCLDDLGTHDASELVTEYQMRVAAAKGREDEKRNRGLGKLIRQSVLQAPSTTSSLVESGSALSASKIVGTDEATVEEESKKLEKLMAEPQKTVVKKKGSFMEWLDRNEKERAEASMRRREEMEALYREKMTQKMKNEQRDM